MKGYYVELREVVSKLVLVKTEEEPTEGHVRELLEDGRYEEKETTHESFEEIVSIEAES